MKTIGTHNVPFPEPHTDEVHEWKPVILYRALHSRVLCVARTRIEGAWAAYCKPVPGMCHEEEMHDVLYDGAKLHEDVARVLFTEFEGVPYAK